MAGNLSFYFALSMESSIFFLVARSSPSVSFFVAGKFKYSLTIDCPQDPLRPVLRLVPNQRIDADKILTVCVCVLRERERESPRERESAPERERERGL
jgi:hypothetical protein